MPRIGRRITQFERKDIKKLFQIAHTVYKHAGLTIKRAPAVLSYGRILIITPKKIGNAPTRNQLRRRIKAIFYTEKLYEKGYDIIVMCSQQSPMLSFQELRSIFMEIFDAQVSH